MARSKSTSARRSRTLKNGQLPRRLPNSELRTREHLTVTEVQKLLASAKKRTARYTHRDHTLLRTMFLHGLRVGETVDLQWTDVDLDAGELHVRRIKNGIDTTHPLDGAEVRALRKLRRDEGDANGGFVFRSERGGPLSVAAVQKLVARLGEHAKLGFKAHPHMLRHACGYALANKGMDTRSLQEFLGHKNIQNTVRYTTLAAGRFKNVWRGIKV